MNEHDELFDRQIHDAYETIELSEEAQSRMLANLLAAQSEREAAAAEPRRSGAPAHLKPRVVEGGRADAPRKHVWHVALPLAAVLLVAVVVVQLWPSRRDTVMDVKESDAATMAESSAAGGAAADDAATPLDAGAPSEDALLAEEESFDVELEEVGEAAPTAKVLQNVDWYPRITLSDGTTLTTLADGMNTKEVAPDRVGASLGTAKAQPFDDDEVVSCEVFKLADDATAYAVRYEGEQSYWYCVPL